MKKQQGICPPRVAGGSFPWAPPPPSLSQCKNGGALASVGEIPTQVAFSNLQQRALGCERRGWGALGGFQENGGASRTAGLRRFPLPSATAARASGKAAPNWNGSKHLCSSFVLGLH